METKYIDLTNQKFGNFTVLEKAPTHKTSSGCCITMWKCKCDCGTIFVTSSQKIRKGHTKSCGCLLKENKGSKFEDISGNKYGKLTVLRMLKPHEKVRKGYSWLCQCDCGKIVHGNANKLKSGHTKSCGCLLVDFISSLNKKYEISDSRLYRVYRSMIDRCANKKNKRYDDYGGKGINVCEEWMENFDNFATWSYQNGWCENAPRGQCTLDRIDCYGNYEPNNCRWVSNKVQQNNKTNNHLLEHNGEIKTMKEWSECLGISYSKIVYHIGKGRTIKQIIDNYIN